MVPVYSRVLHSVRGVVKRFQGQIQIQLPEYQRENEAELPNYGIAIVWITKNWSGSNGNNSNALGSYW